MDDLSPCWIEPNPSTQEPQKSESSSVGMTVSGGYNMPMDSISMCSNTLYMLKMDVGSRLRWLSALTMTLYHHFDSTSDPPELHHKSEPRSNLGMTVCGCYHMPIEIISMCSNTFYMLKMDAGADWDGCHPQP
jgi:hypothetical protein